MVFPGKCYGKLSFGLHTTKRVPDHLAVQAVALLTVIGLGSTPGPLIASFVMAHTKSEALLYFFIFWAVLAGIYSLYRRFCTGQQKPSKNLAMW